MKNNDMKLSTKPIASSPDKFPPPLMRFLRSTAGNRSRGRSRSSPMFLRKKNTNTAIETKEPSSPKVTCMGQVRVKRSSKQPTAKRVRPSPVAADGPPTKCHPCCCWWWVPHALFCHRFTPGTSCCHCQCQPVRPNWGCFGRKGKASTKVTEASTKNGLKEELEGEEDRVNSDGFVSNSSSPPPPPPPRNALLLMRSKSAPYSSSSLASRFWGSPLRSEETEQQPSDSENQIPSEGLKDPKLEFKLRFFKELEDSLREKIMESEKVDELKRREEAEGDSAARALVLTRCKSERARTRNLILR